MGLSSDNRLVLLSSMIKAYRKEGVRNMVLVLTKEPADKKACRWGTSYSQYGIKHDYNHSTAYGQKCHNYGKYNYIFPMNTMDNGYLLHTYHVYLLPVNKMMLTF